VKEKEKNLNKEIAWLKRDKYGLCEIGYRTNKAGLAKDIERLKRGEPLDYVIGWKDFLGCKIDLSYRPLIPREETEFWVGGVVDRLCEIGSRAPRDTISHNNAPLKVLDLFAGSGCIGLAVLKNCQNVEVTFADKEENSLKQIKKNLSILIPTTLERPPKGSSGRFEVIQSDVFNLVASRGQSFERPLKDCPPKALKKFDIIFANPPYIPIKRQKVQKSVKDWEPHQALYSGVDGLMIIKKFLHEAKKYLNLEGKIYLEFGYGQKGAIEKLLRQNKYKNWEFHKDQFGKWRWVAITS
jgi:release factor glutamine methyltransferase